MQVMKTIKIAAVIAVAAVAGMIAWDHFETEALRYPATVTIEARPGTAVVVPFSRRITDSRIDAVGVIDADPLIDPAPLPQEITMLHSSLFLMSRSATGDLLLWVPEAAAGNVVFSLSASGNGSGTGGRAVFAKSEATEITLDISGEPFTDNAPELSGVWADSTQQWDFRNDERPSLDISYPTGEEKTVYYKAYPDGNGKWFLVDVGGAAAYWVAHDGASLAVAHPDAEFDPFAVLQRQ